MKKYISLIIFTFSLFLFSAQVDARGGCFASGTLILTPQGNTPIEQLREGDVVIGYDFVSKKQINSTISEIEIYDRDEYYLINNKTKVTGEHPFYVSESGSLVIREVSMLRVGDMMTDTSGNPVLIEDIKKIKGNIRVYNLLNVEPTHNYYADGLLVHNKGGCFGKGTLILTPHGNVPIEQLHKGDKIVGYDFMTRRKVVSTISEIEEYDRKEYYLINNKTKVTAEHPFYLMESGSIITREVADLKAGDIMIGEIGEKIEIKSILKMDGVIRVYNLLNVEPTHNYYADGILAHNKGGGCFAAGTTILTPGGEVTIEKLQSGDRIIGMDFTNNTITTSTIGWIEIYDRDEYYLINNKTKVTGEHPFYVSESGSLVIREVSMLRVGDMMTDTSGNLVLIEDIKKIKGNIRVYNLLNVEPTHNYYADGLLVHNKGSSSTSSRPLTPEEIAANNAKHQALLAQEEALLAQIKGSWNPILWLSVLGSVGLLMLQDPNSSFRIFLIMGLYLIVVFGSILYKRVILVRRDFTTDIEVIGFVKNIVPEFTAKHDITYKSDTETWHQKRPGNELQEIEYAPISKIEMIDLVTSVFVKYESDWTKKNWEGMKSYLTSEYYDEQKDLFENDFGDNYDINYDPKVDMIIPVKKKNPRKTEGGGYTQSIEFQVNANMINFEVNPSGNVVSGKPQRRFFTDYWTFTFDINKNKWLLDNIRQG